MGQQPACSAPGRQPDPLPLLWNPCRLRPVGTGGVMVWRAALVGHHRCHIRKCRLGVHLVPHTLCQLHASSEAVTPELVHATGPVGMRGVFPHDLGGRVDVSLTQARCPHRSSGVIRLGFGLGEGCQRPRCSLLNYEADGRAFYHNVLTFNLGSGHHHQVVVCSRRCFGRGRQHDVNFVLVAGDDGLDGR